MRVQFTDNADTRNLGALLELGIQNGVKREKWIEVVGAARGAFGKLSSRTTLLRQLRYWKQLDSDDVQYPSNRMLIWSCVSNCLQATSWSGFTSGAANDGADGIAMADLEGALVLSISNNDRVLTRYCGNNCQIDTNWQEAPLDTAQTMTADYDPFTYVGATCSGVSPLFATWHLTQGVVAISPSGSVAFAHTASILRTCAASSSVVYLP